MKIQGRNRIAMNKVTARARPFQTSSVPLIAAAVYLILVAVFLIVNAKPAEAQGNRVRAETNGDNFCAVCHSNTQVELQASTHLREGVTCTDCHGGDQAAQSVAGAHSHNFRGSFDRKQIVELCSSCHSDNEKMKPYGIPIDQHALYLTSGHGKKLMQGDVRVAVCTDCHGVHQVLSAKDPKSPVFRQNIPQTCGRCHQDAALMKSYNLSPGIVDDYQQSVHGKALFEQHSTQAPECTRCHGTHGAAPPGIGDVAKVCGQCHIRTLEAFRDSPHKAAMGTGTQSECASCHSNHRIEHAGHETWSSKCTNCHESNGPAVDRGTKIQALFIQAEGELQKAKLSVEDARRIPLDVSDYETRLSDSLTYMVEARPLSHNLSLEDVEELTRRSRSIAQEVQSEIHERVNVFRGRYIILSIVWFYILITIAAVYRFRRVVETRKEEQAEQ